jgi:hypothetical protein
MPREQRIEDKAGEFIRLAWPGTAWLKIGWEGWPDRLALLGASTHAWAEIKQKGEALRADQKVRIKDLVEAGEVVVVIDDLADLPPLVADLKKAESVLQALSSFRRFARTNEATIRALRASGCGG